MNKGIQRSTNFFPAYLAVAGMLLLFSAGLSGQAGASDFSTLMNRPPNVPAEYVATPFGYFHPSCVLLLPEGDTLLADGGVQHADGTTEPAHICNFPHYTSSGAMVPADAKASDANPLELDGWLEAVWALTNTSYYKIVATWTVPPAPKSNDGQILYFFPGFEDSNNVISIVQPVMQWGNNGIFGGQYWLMSSWNCCISNGAYYSTPLDVSIGDTILGKITSTCKAGNNYCAKWNVVSEDKTTEKKTTLAKTPADGQVWNWAFGAVSEDYNLVQCSDFPNDSSLTFTVHLYDQNGNVIASPPWQPWEMSNPDPECNYAQKITKTKETLKY